MNGFLVSYLSIIEYSVNMRVIQFLLLSEKLRNVAAKIRNMDVYLIGGNLFDQICKSYR